MNNLNSLELARVEEEVQLLVAEIEAMRAIHDAKLSETRALARREAFEEALAACTAYNDCNVTRNAIATLLDSTD